MRRFFPIIAFLLCISAPARAQNTAGWEGSMFAGYNRSSGNTNSSSGVLRLDAQKKTESLAYLLKGSVLNSSSEKKMDAQKWDALARMSLDFGREDRWFSFYQVTADHDYFADIDYRITPGIGVGYHLARSENFTWDADTGLGYRIERHRINREEDDEFLTALVHTFLKRRVFERSFVSEDLTITPGLEAGSGTTLRSETSLTNPLTNALALEVKLIVDYNSQPAEGKKKTDTQLITGVNYAF